MILTIAITFLLMGQVLGSTKNISKRVEITEAPLEGRTGKILSFDSKSKMYNVEIIDSENNKTMEQYINENRVKFIEENDVVGPLEINLVRHAKKKEEDHQKYQIDEPNENYKWGLVEIGEGGGLKAAYNLGIHFYYKYKNSDKNTPLIYVSPFRRTIQTAIPTAKALKTKIRIEYGLFESFHGFPTEEEIKEFYAGNEEYIDTEYESKYFIENSSMYDLTQNKNAAKHRLLKYQKHQQMTQYLKEEQLKENRDIIVIAHQEEMYEIGNMLVNPDKNGGKEAKIIDAYLKGRHGKILSYDPNSKMYNVKIVDSKNNKTMEQQINEKLVQFNDKKLKWQTGTLIPFYKKKDENYEESEQRYERATKYNLHGTGKIQEFEKEHGTMEKFMSNSNLTYTEIIDFFKEFEENYGMEEDCFSSGDDSLEDNEVL